MHVYSSSTIHNNSSSWGGAFLSPHDLPFVFPRISTRPVSKICLCASLQISRLSDFVWYLVLQYFYWLPSLCWEKVWIAKHHFGGSWSLKVEWRARRTIGCRGGNRNWNGVGGWMRRNKTIKRHRKGINFPKECRIFMIWSSHPFEKWRSFFIMYFHRRLLQPEAPSSRGDPRSNLEVLCHEATWISMTI